MPAESVIERLKRLEAEATKGPWWTDPGESSFGLFLGNGAGWQGRGSPGFMLCVESDKNEGYANGEPDAELIVATRNILPALLRVAEAAHELYVLRGRISPEEYFNSSEACRARTKLDLAVVDLRDMEAGGE